MSYVSKDMLAHHKSRLMYYRFIHQLTTTDRVTNIHAYLHHRQMYWQCVSTPIEHLEWSIAALSALTFNGVHTVGDLMGLDSGRLLDLPRVGSKVDSEIREWFNEGRN